MTIQEYKEFQKLSDEEKLDAFKKDRDPWAIFLNRRLDEGKCKEVKSNVPINPHNNDTSEENHC